MRQDFLNRLYEAETKQDLYDIAGDLNIRPEHVHADKVTILAFMDLMESRIYVLNLINQSFSEVSNAKNK